MKQVLELYVEYNFKFRQGYIKTKYSYRTKLLFDNKDLLSQHISNANIPGNSCRHHLIVWHV